MTTARQLIEMLQTAIKTGDITSESPVVCATCKGITQQIVGHFARNKEYVIYPRKELRCKGEIND